MGLELRERSGDTAYMVIGIQMVIEEMDRHEKAQGKCREQKMKGLGVKKEAQTGKRYEVKLI